MYIIIVYLTSTMKTTIEMVLPCSSQRHVMFEAEASSTDGNSCVDPWERTSTASPRRNSSETFVIFRSFEVWQLAERPRGRCHWFRWMMEVFDCVFKGWVHHRIHKKKEIHNPQPKTTWTPQRVVNFENFESGSSFPRGVYFQVPCFFFGGCFFFHGNFQSDIRCTFECCETNAWGNLNVLSFVKIEWRTSGRSNPQQKACEDPWLEDESFPFGALFLFSGAMILGQVVISNTVGSFL